MTKPTIAPRPESEQLESNLLRIAYKGRYLIAIGAIVGIGLGYLNHVRSDLEYSSTAQLLIKSKTTAPIAVDGTTARQETTDITTHAAVLQSPTLIDRAIRDYDLAKLPIAKSGASLRGMLLKNLDITPREGSDAILDISFTCADPDSSAQVVNGLTSAFQDFYGEMDQNVGQRMLELVQEANEVLEGQLKDKQVEYDRFRESSPLIDRDGTALNLHQERMMGIEAERAHLELQVNALAVEIKAIENALASGMDVNAIRILSEQISGARSEAELNGGTQGGIPSSTLHGQLIPLLLEHQSLVERFGEGHPDVLSLKRKIELLRELEPSIGDAEKDMKFEDFARAEIEAYLTARRAIRDAKAKELASLHTMFEKEQKEARALISYQVRDSELRSDLQRKQSLFDTVVSRLDEVNLTKDHGGYNIQVLAYAEPGSIVSLSLVQQLLRGCVVGSFGAFGLAYLVVGRDARFTDIKQVSTSLGLPIMGTIPNFEVRTEGIVDEAIAPSVQAFHRPKSNIAEGYRGIRTGLYFSLNDRKQVVQITSPLPGEGKSTLTANLAVSMAASGKKVLVIDADMRRPRQHKLLGLNLDNDGVGLSRVLSGDAEVDQGVFETAVPNLSLMPCGERPDNPAELLVSKKIDEVVAALSEKYDFVLIDSPPMLAVSDPSSIASRVEGVLLTFDLEKTSKHAVARACELLQKADTEIVGVVVNQVETRKEGKLGRMYGYGYGYGYGNYYDSNYYYSYGGYDEPQSSHDEVKPPKSRDRRRTEEQAGV